MQIPILLKQKKSKWYVAISQDEAFSSWDSFEKAINSYERLQKYSPDDAKRVIGILQVSNEYKLLHGFSKEKYMSRKKSLIKTKQTGMKLPVELLQRVENLSIRAGYRPSQIVRICIENYIGVMEDALSETPWARKD
jgi:hypothetical protein